MLSYNHGLKPCYNNNTILINQLTNTGHILNLTQPTIVLLFINKVTIHTTFQLAATGILPFLKELFIIHRIPFRIL